MKRLIKFLALYIALLISVVPAYSSTMRETFTEEDMLELNKYLEEDYDKEIQSIALKDYILSKFDDNASKDELYNGIRFMYKLNPVHRIYFKNILMSYIVTILSNPDISSEYIREETNLYFAMHGMGLIRDNEVIDFLLNLVEPLEKWPKVFQEQLVANKERDILIIRIRTRAMGALLEPQDDMGKDLLYLIESKVNGFDDDWEKEQMIEFVNIWKDIYERSNVKEFEAYKK